MKKFISEKELFSMDAWLPEALMLTAHLQEVSKQKLVEKMKITPAHAQRLINLLQDCGLVKVEDGKKKPNFTEKEFFENYKYTKSDLENLYAQPAENSAEQDGLFLDALAFAAECGTISITALRRKFEIGYPRAARLVDAMEAAGYVSAAEGAKDRTVFVKKEDLNNLSNFSRPKDVQKERIWQEEERARNECKQEYNLDNLNLLDENGSPLDESEEWRLKMLLTDQFCGFGIVCIEDSDAEIFFKRNNYTMRCKTFYNPAKKDLQEFLDKNKIDAALVLFEVGEKTQIADIVPLIPKTELFCFAVSNPLPNISKINANIIY